MSFHASAILRLAKECSTIHFRARNFPDLKLKFGRSARPGIPEILNDKG